MINGLILQMKMASQQMEESDLCYNGSTQRSNTSLSI